MFKIYKYEIELTGITSLQIPKGSKIVHVNNQRNHIFIWCIVNTSQDLTTRNFYILGTGWEIPITGDYVGTVFIDSYVWHVFEIINTKL